MQELNLNEKSIEPKKKFWQRQFQNEATKSQKIFDWIFGVVLPVICFVFDPIVFKGNAWGASLLGNYKPFAYILSFVSVMAMSAWLIWGEKLKWLNAFLAGLFAVGGIVSLGIGIVLAPISLLGLIIIVGVLGFTPLFSSVVYLRNAVRVFRSAKPFLEKSVLVHSLILSAIFSAVVPSVINMEIGRILSEMENGDARTIRANAQKLKYITPLVNFDTLPIRYYRAESGTEEMKAVAEVYKELTGEDIETKGRVLMD